jgi:hypothetical protein
MACAICHCKILRRDMSLQNTTSCDMSLQNTTSSLQDVWFFFFECFCSGNCVIGCVIGCVIVALLLRYYVLSVV